EKALANAKFVVVQDISHKSDTTKFADLLLPAAAWLEKQGTMTNSERRISYLPKVIEAPEEARADVEILCDFAAHMGFRGFNYQSSEEIYREYCRMTKNTNIDISGLTYDRLKTQGSMQWPVPTHTHPGTPRLFEDHKFYTPNQKAKFNVPYSVNNASIATSAEYPLILITGRIRDQWHSMTRTGKVARLQTHYAQPKIEIHPVDAYIHHIKQGDICELKSRNGNIRLKVKITDAVREGVLFA